MPHTCPILAPYLPHTPYPAYDPRAERGAKHVLPPCVGLCGSEAGRSHLERDAGAMFSKLSSIGPWHTASVLRTAAKLHIKRSVHERAVSILCTQITRQYYRISCIAKTTGVPLLTPSSSTRAPLVYLTASRYERRAQQREQATWANLAHVGVAPVTPPLHLPSDHGLSDGAGPAN